jgi:oligopeptidase A
MKNPLLTIKNLNIPIFNAFKPKDIAPTISYLLRKNRKLLKKLLTQKKYTWDNLVTPFEEANNELHKVWGVVSHLNHVLNSEELRKAYNQTLPKLSDYSSEVSHNQKLYQAIQSIAKSSQYRHFDVAQKKVITNDLRDFKLSGVTLPTKKKKQFAQLHQQLTKLGAKFSENVLDATQGWYKLITNKAELSGLPEYAIATAKQSAQKRHFEGWLFTLELNYSAIMLYADSPTLRQEFYTAYTTRASDQGPNSKRWDNTKIIDQILTIRLQLAKLLKFKNFSEYALTTRMAKNPKKVISFLQQLIKYAKPKALQELKELTDFAKKKYHIDHLQPWDIGYYSEKLQQAKYQISQEELRPYFPEPRALAGLFDLTQRLFGIKLKKVLKAETWHQDVKVFDLLDAKNNFKGRLYLDLYARLNKQGGAWMDAFCSRQCLTSSSCNLIAKSKQNRAFEEIPWSNHGMTGKKVIQFPVAYIICNFNPPIGNHPALFTHHDIETLFHEFGHSLQHLLTTIDYAPVSGLNGIPNDAIEVASQFMENWCWDKSLINKVAKHYKTGKALPTKMFNNMLKTKNFQSGMQAMRQLEFALFDMRLHNEFNPRHKNQVQKILDEIRGKTASIPIPKFNRFQHGFSHIFGGGYAAGYYSYKWSEVLSSDAFAKFLENGKFNKKTGASFLHNILEPGGSVDPMTLFKRFRGRAPKIEALLKQDGVLPNTQN